MTAGVESGGFLCRFRSQLFFSPSGSSDGQKSRKSPPKNTFPESLPRTDLELKRALDRRSDKLGFKC